MYCTRQKTEEIMKAAKSIVIVGYGIIGQELHDRLVQEYKSSIIAIFDNRKKDEKVCVPYKIEGEDILYVVAVGDEGVRKELYTQLQGLGISDEHIVMYYKWLCPDYFRNLDPKDYKEAVDDLYTSVLGKKMNWENPRTYNEIICWEKIYAQDERRTRLVDKYSVREWIKEKIGEEYLVGLLGVWDEPEEINFSILPKQYVLKLNNGCRRNIIVKDSATIDKEAIIKQLREWKNDNFAFNSLEMQYYNIPPKIICEEYIEGLGTTTHNMDVFCFHGEPKYVWYRNIVFKNGIKELVRFYDLDWNTMDVEYDYPLDERIVEKPVQLEEMLELSRILSKEFRHVRVDWYVLPTGKLLFGEMTFSSATGIGYFKPEEWDRYFGDLITGPEGNL